MLLFKKSSFPVVHGSEGKETKRLEEKDRDGETRRVKGGGRERERERGCTRDRLKMGVERRWLGKGKRGREKSVKYPQLDATHWHTVSMQILFTLSLSPSLPLYHVCLPLSLFHPATLLPSSVKAERRTCTYPVCTVHTHVPSPNSAVDPHYPSFRVDSITFGLRSIGLPPKQTLCMNAR